MKVSIRNLEIVKQVIALSLGRVGRKENYALRRNVDRIDIALKPLADAVKQEPISFLQNEDATENQKKQGEEALEKERDIMVDFDTYKLDIDEACDCLKKLSDKRENLSSEQLAELNEDYELAMTLIGMYRD